MKKVFLLAALAAPGFLWAQKQSNKLNFTKGQRMDVVTNMNITAQSVMGPSSGTVTIADTYTINDASENAISLVKVPKQIKMNFSMGSQEMKVDSDNPADLKGMLGEPVKEIMSQKPEFTIDATGKIIAVKKEEKKKSDPAASGMMGMMLPGLDFSAAALKEGQPSIFQVLPASEISVGTTWTDSISLEGNKNVTVYKVKDITDKEIIVDFTGTGNTVTSQSAMGMNVDVNATSQATGSILLDKATGIIKQKTTTNNTETTMNLGGREISSTIKSTSVTNFSLQ